MMAHSVPGVALHITAAQEQALAEAVTARFVERLIDALQGPIAEGSVRDGHRARYRRLLERASTLGFVSEYDVAVFAAASDRFGEGFEADSDAEAGQVASAIQVPSADRAERLVALLQSEPAEVRKHAPAPNETATT
ncbi:MAG: hypothetical protein MUF00_14235 [Gemmatimonadaceae bacterium]|nr:hypothetical protein [Gemmatimonadaceae bacterium]